MEYIRTNYKRKISAVAPEFKGAPAFDACPDCHCKTCFIEIAQDDYHDHTNYRCVNCKNIIHQEF